MKVLYIKQSVSPYRSDFFNELGKYVELDVLYDYRYAYGRDKEWSSKPPVNHTEMFGKSIIIKNRYSINMNFRKHLKKKYDFIILGQYATMTGAMIIQYLRLRKIPLILNIDGGIIRRDNWLVYKIKNYLISSAAYWLSPSVNSDEYLLHYGADKDRIFRYPFTSTKDEDVLDEIIPQQEKSKLKAKLGIDGTKLVLSIGQFIHRKGFDVLLNAFRDFPKDTALCIIGGKPTDEYLDIVKNNNIKNVYFKGFMQKSELEKYFMAADIFVLPTRYDIWGLVINEAMAFGLPIVTTDKCIAGLELVDDNVNGYLVPIEDANALSEKVDIILSDEKKLKDMSENSLKKIREYTIEKMAEKHFEILNKIKQFQ